MDQQKRLLVALGVSFLIFVVWMQFFGPKPPPPQAADLADGGALAVADAGLLPQAVAASTDGGAPALIGSAEAGDGGALLGLAPVELPPLVKVVGKRATTALELSSEGAGLLRAELQGRKLREQHHLTVGEGFKKLFGGTFQEPAQMNLAYPAVGLPLPLAVSIEGAQPFLASARYKVEEPAERERVFTATQGVWQVRKHLSWDAEGFSYQLAVEVKNLSATPQSGELAVHFTREVDGALEVEPGWLSGVGNQTRSICQVGEKLEVRLPPAKPNMFGCGGSTEYPKDYRGALAHFGIDQQYFLATVFPLEGVREGRCTMGATPGARSVTGLFPLTVAPGETVTQRFGAYLGPKDIEGLEAVFGAKGADGQAYHPPLEKTVDFGMWAALCHLLLSVMRFFYGVVGNWGVAIILLTVTVKVVLLPLTHRQLVSAEQMKEVQQKLGPKLQEIKKKYGEDPQRQQQETFKLYQQEGVNPFSGCFTMVLLLIQMPVWIALFSALRYSFELYREPFFGPLWQDLTYKDPIYFLPLALGVTMFVTQKLQPQMMDRTQTMMITYIMPVFFTALMLNYPAGLTLYIFTNNIISIVQQYALRKWLARKKQQGGGAALVKEKTRRQA